MTSKKNNRESRPIQRAGRILFVLILAVILFALGMLFVKIKTEPYTPQTNQELQMESAGEEVLGEVEIQEPTPEELAAQARAEIEARFEEGDRVVWKECASENRIVMDFIGDFCLAEGKSTVVTMDSIGAGIEGVLSPDVMAELKGADLMMLNHEFSMSDGGSPTPGKTYTYRAKPSRVQEMVTLETDIVSLANNHAYDYGPEALVDTLDILDEASIPYVGAGRNLDEAMEPYYFVMNNKVIAIVSATQIERSTNYTKQATEDRAGVLKTLNSELFVQVIAEAETKADYVLVYVHWGTEKAPHYEGDQVALAEKYVAAGADVIIGGHTHCLQGIDYVQGVPVIYSLGNFWFNQRTQDTGISQVIIQEDGTIEFRFLPCVQSNNKTYMADGEEWQRIITYMNSIGGGSHIDGTGLVTETE